MHYVQVKSQKRKNEHNKCVFTQTSYAVNEIFQRRISMCQVHMLRIYISTSKSKRITFNIRHKKNIAKYIKHNLSNPLLQSCTTLKFCASQKYAHCTCIFIVGRYNFKEQYLSHTNFLIQGIIIIVKRNIIQSKQYSQKVLDETIQISFRMCSRFETIYFYRLIVALKIFQKFYATNMNFLVLVVYIHS
eukprot:TRINITY_DN10143_c1_g1_i1.p1 TRINITY_DN10143_c1_g1~~TRINITY_DN10143_c1_g1_i1.p1  ORF type:complete len:189 (-),score=-16.48 TRINITY_DN10143_c1_g1_i1:268-834(-)